VIFAWAAATAPNEAGTKAIAADKADWAAASWPYSAEISPCNLCW
jgi:hypothetical protein